MSAGIGELFSRTITNIFGSKNEREIKALQPFVDEINEIYAELSSLTDEELKGKTADFRRRLDDGETTDDIMTEAYACVKEVCRRLMGKKWLVTGHDITWDMIPFDCQLMGAIVLHQGKIAEMATGEGKSLVAAMPLYLNALPGKGVHFVTVNDYLVKRDVDWYGKIYDMLGLTVGSLVSDTSTEEHKAAYNCDITYGTNNEFGFDYLRDNMAIRPEDVVQREFYYALVDEVDSVLIDEARTPLIISGPVGGTSTHKYEEMKPLVSGLVGQQMRLVNTKIADAEKLLDTGNEYEAGMLLLQAQRGTPKNKRLMKLIADRPELKKLIMGVENDFMRDKRMPEIDEELLFVVDEKNHTINFTDKALNGMRQEERDVFVIPDLNEEISEIEADETLSAEEKILKQEQLTAEFALKTEKIHNANQLLRAYTLFEKDQQYVVQESKVMIVDEFTGRLMTGRRYSDGLHQALEAKENVHIEQETQTLATITLQNYFRMYEKLAGMTGTAETEAPEFWEIYKLDVVVVPPNKPCIRVDNEDQIYRTRREKYNAIIQEITRLHTMGRPVLVGTVSVDVSETLSRMLKRTGVMHNVLNAKYHQREAEIISLAGKRGTVTIATNMAGRGTDIKLDPEVRAMDDPDVPGGLQIVGTERHEARRIDRQLRGRSGRQGDPGSTMFFLSLEDDLMRLFGSDRIAGIMSKLGVDEGEVITHSMVTKAIDRAQKRVEAQNFSIRKHLLEYDNVMNSQREVIYELRNAALKTTNVRDRLFEMIDTVVDNMVAEHSTESGKPLDWDMDELLVKFTSIFFTRFTLTEDQELTLTQEGLANFLVETAKKSYMQKATLIDPESLAWNERIILLTTIDNLWKEHLYEMDQLKEGIGLRGYGQRDPLIEYKREGYLQFDTTLNEINSTTLKTLMRAISKVQFEHEERLSRSRMAAMSPMSAIAARHDSTAAYGAQTVESGPGGQVAVKQKTVRNTIPKVGRNEPCPCGSGKKYKVCCGR